MLHKKKKNLFQPCTTAFSVKTLDSYLKLIQFLRHTSENHNFNKQLVYVCFKRTRTLPLTLGHTYRMCYNLVEEREVLPPFPLEHNAFSQSFFQWSS